MLRAVDAAGNYTPLTAGSTSTPVKVNFREVTITGGTPAGAAGVDLAGVGDVNGDGIDDMLVGGRGVAYLVFGSTTGFGTTPSVTFTSATPEASSFGEYVAAVGDFNGDMRKDFAIAERSNTGFTPTSSGRVLVFFGRAPTDPWPTTVALSAGSCGADICFEATTSMYLGSDIASAGDFNGDGTGDLAVGAARVLADIATFPGSVQVGRVYVLLGGTVYTSGARPASEKFWGVRVPLEASDPDPKRRGFVLTGDENYAGFGAGATIANVGAFDVTAGTDLVFSAMGEDLYSPSPLVNGGVFFLSGRSYTDNTGLVTLALSDLGFRDTAGKPSGQPIQVLNAGDAVQLNALGNAYDLPGANRKAIDLSVWHVTATSFSMYLGDTNFQPSDAITVGQAGGGGSYFGLSIAGDVDLDGDNLPEVCVGSVKNLKTAMSPGTVSLFHADRFAARVSNKTITSDAASALNPLASGSFDSANYPYTIPGERIVQFVGDLNKDDKPDLAIGSPTLNGTSGAVTILY
jgi:hypothetical protein